ncbi:hypothetical protein [Methylocella sp.]|jgi:hypothetical protein|uniref:hypothetical protein n=1 Tax=Methylocella sp. TaxID=1978226 RepID=UPI003C26ECD1
MGLEAGRASIKMAGFQTETLAMTSTHALERWALAFKSVDWLIPAYLQMQFLSQCVANIEQATTENKPKILQGILRKTYDERHLASMLLGLYSKTIYIRDYERQISQTIEASCFGLHHAAVATMIPVLEGIIRKNAVAGGRDVGSGTRKIIEELDNILANEMASPNRFEERVIMFQVLRDFFNERLLIRTTDYSGSHEFNRHGILHGVFENYGSETNFFRCITILELLCFTMGMLYGGSCFAPEETAQSAKLANYYRCLKFWSARAAPFRAIHKQLR